MEPPVVDAEEEALRDLGRETDIAEGRPLPKSEAAHKPESPAAPAEEPAEKPQPTAEKQPVSSESEPEKPPPVVEGRERDELGRFKAQEQVNGEEPTIEVKKTLSGEKVEKSRSKYAEARERDAKEQARQERSWTALQREKEEFRAQQAKWEEQRRVEQLQTQVQQRPLEKGGIDIQGYQRAYQDFRRQAQQSDSPEDWRNSLHSLETVLELEAQGRQESERRQQAQYELAWRTDMDAGIAKNPDLQDPNSALYQEVDRIVQQEPYLFYIPGGFNKAVEIATLLLAAGSDSELRDENEKLRAQLEQYQRSSQPARGGPGKPPQGPRSQEEMSEAEEESFLRDLTYREDSAMRR